MTPRTRSVPVVCLLVVAVAAASGVGAGAVTVDSLTYGGDSVVSTPDGGTIIWQSDDHTFEASLRADATHEASVCLFANASTGPRELGCANASISAGGEQTVEVAVGPWPANLTGDRTVRAVVTDRASGDRLAERSLDVTVYARDGDVDGDGLTNEAEVEAGTDLRGRDTDNDSVSDALEVRVHGTDPTNNDTDADGLDDGLEIKTYHTDPLDVDTDDDGLSDGREVDIGTAPTRADTDGDGLEDGPEVNTYQTDPTAVDTDGDGLGDGTEVDLGTNPTVEDTDGDGLTDGDEVTLYDTDPTRSDTDGDGLDDHAEVTTHDTDPTRSDTDGDGLDDGEEVEEHGTDPLVADTDGDGQDDGLEVRLGSDPTDPTSTGDPGPVTTVSVFVADRPLVAGLGVLLVLCAVVVAVAWRFADRLPVDRARAALATGGADDPAVDRAGNETEAATGARPDSAGAPSEVSEQETSGVESADESDTGDGEPVLSDSDPGTAGVYDLPDDAVLTNEERVARLLDENGGRMLQSDMVEAADWSKATVSRVLTRMEEAGEITRVDIGRGNLVARPGDEPANAGSPFSE